MAQYSSNLARTHSVRCHDRRANWRARSLSARNGGGSAVVVGETHFAALDGALRIVSTSTKLLATGGFTGCCGT